MRYLNYFRLAFFSLAYGLTGALLGGTLNRIMIVEFAISAALVGLFFAVPVLVSPLRVWLGYRSDAYPILGRRREPYIILGALIAAAGILGVVFSTIRSGSTPFLLGGIFLAFIVYGIGRNLAHNTFEALLADTFTGDQRPRAMTLFEVATLLGLVIGAGGIGGALRQFSPERLVSVSLIVAVAVVLLTALATLGQERRDAHTDEATATARRLPFPSAVRDLLLADPQVRLFFTLILFTIVGTLAQDLILEPYAGLVLGMSVGQTTQLTAFWGIGVMISMLVSGTVLIKIIGYQRVLRVGLAASILSFAGLILTGVTGNIALFRALVVVMGLGTGLAGAGLLTGLITFTTPIRAGLLMGVWGMANLMGRALGSLMGGVVVDVMRAVTGGNALVSYATVFGLEVAMLVVALALTFRFHPEASQAQSEENRLRSVPLGSGK